MTCTICKKKAVDSMQFDAGNNAEQRVSVKLCNTHLNEASDAYDDFQYRHAQKIERALVEFMQE